MVATSHASTAKPAFDQTAGDVRISDLSNDSVIIRLHFTINFLNLRFIVTEPAVLLRGSRPAA